MIRAQDLPHQRVEHEGGDDRHADPEHPFQQRGDRLERLGDPLEPLRNLGGPEVDAVELEAAIPRQLRMRRRKRIARLADRGACIHASLHRHPGTTDP